MLPVITALDHMDKNKFSNSRGYTLIEIIVILVIIGIMSGFGMAKYNTYTQQLVLKNQAKEIANVVELAKKKAISADLYQDCSNFQGYQVAINSNNFLLNFNCGGTYITVQSYQMTSSVTITAGTGNFNFPPLGNGTNLTINSLRLKNSKLDPPKQCMDISISPIGVVDINETLISC